MFFYVFLFFACYFQSCIPMHCKSSFTACRHLFYGVPFLFLSPSPAPRHLKWYALTTCKIFFVLNASATSLFLHLLHVPSSIFILPIILLRIFLSQISIISISLFRTQGLTTISHCWHFDCSVDSQLEMFPDLSVMLSVSIMLLHFAFLLFISIFSSLFSVSIIFRYSN